MSYNNTAQIYCIVILRKAELCLNFSSCRDPLPIGKSVNIRIILKYWKKHSLSLPDTKYNCAALFPSYVFVIYVYFQLYFLKETQGKTQSELTEMLKIVRISWTSCRICTWNKIFFKQFYLLVHCEVTDDIRVIRFKIGISS